jgi:hypothetical protein
MAQRVEEKFINLISTPPLIICQHNTHNQSLSRANNNTFHHLRNIFSRFRSLGSTMRSLTCQCEVG